MKTTAVLDHDYSMINTDEAFNEGWGVFYTATQDATHNLYELQRYDEQGVFESDSKAQVFVVDNAIKNPKGNHAQALLFLAKHSPNEVDSVIRQSVGVDKFKELKSVMRYTEFDNF